MARLPIIAPLPDYTALDENTVPVDRQQVVEDNSGQILGQGIERAANTLSDFQQNLARAKAANALDDHELTVKNVSTSITEQVQSGALPYDQAAAEYAKQTAAIPAPQIPGLDPIAQQHLQSGMKHNVMAQQFAINGVVRQAQKNDYLDQFQQALDTKGKHAGQPGADIDAINKSIDSFVPQALNAGIPKVKVNEAIQNFKDKNWMNNATQAAIQAKDNLPALKQLQYDLTDPNGFYAGKLDTDKRNVVLNKAVDMADGALRMMNTQQEMAYRSAEHAEKLNAQTASKNGDQLLATNKLTPDWIEQNRNALSPSDYRYFYKSLTGGDESSTDPKVYADLYLKAASGEDVRDDARQALTTDHTLSRTDFTKIVSNVDSERPGWFKRGTQFLDQALDPGQLNPDPAAHQSKAFALQDWQDWSAKHPNATEADAQKMQDALAQHYQIVPGGKTPLLMQAPLHLVGTRANPTDEQGKPDPMLNATAARMKAALAAQQITPDEAQEEAKLIMQYRQMYQVQQAAAAAKKASP